MQQARRSSPRVRRQGVAAGQRVLQVSYYRYGRGFCQHFTWTLVRREGHHGGICTPRQLSLSVPRRYDYSIPLATGASSMKLDFLLIYSKYCYKDCILTRYITLVLLLVQYTLVIFRFILKL